MSDHFPHPEQARHRPRRGRTRPRGPRGGAEVMLAVALAGTVLAVLGGAAAVAVVLGTSAVATGPLALGTGAAFVGVLAALLPGTAAAMFLATSALLDARTKVLLCFLPYGLTLALAVPAASLVAVVGRAGAPWVAVVAALGVVAVAAWIAYLTWRDATDRHDARAARFDLAAGAAGGRFDGYHHAPAPGAAPGERWRDAPGGALPPGAPAEPDDVEVDPEEEMGRLAWSAVRDHPRTPLVGAVLVAAAVAAVLVVTGSLATAPSYLPAPHGPVDRVVSPVYATAGGALAGSALWVPLWVAGAALLTVSRGAGVPPRARRLAVLAPPAAAVGCGLLLAVGLALGAVPGIPSPVVRTVVLAALILGAGAAVWWAWRASSLAVGRPAPRPAGTPPEHPLATSPAPLDLGVDRRR